MDFPRSIVIRMFPPSFQDGVIFPSQPDTLCLANFRLSLRDEQAIALTPLPSDGRGDSDWVTAVIRKRVVR
jgi:hypothetical protein